jgi:hypothetical protein
MTSKGEIRTREKSYRGIMVEDRIIYKSLPILSSTSHVSTVLIRGSQLLCQYVAVHLRPMVHTPLLQLEFVLLSYAIGVGNI